MLVLIKITYSNIGLHTTLNQYWESPRALKILSAGRM